MQIDLSWTEQRRHHRPGFYGKEIRVHVSQYFLLFRFFFFSKLGVPLGCLGYKYVPHSLCKCFVTRPINKPYFFLAIYFSVDDFAIFFFCEFFRVDQGPLTFERLGLLVIFCLSNNLSFRFRTHCYCFVQIYSKVIEFVQALISSASLFSRLDLFTIYPAQQSV